MTFGSIFLLYDEWRRLADNSLKESPTQGNMSDQQSTAYNRYRHASTDADLRSALSSDFSQFVNGWTETRPEDVNVSHMPRLSYSKEQFYRLLVSTTLHNVSNTGIALVTFDYDPVEKEYVIVHYPVDGDKREYRLGSTFYIPNSNSFMIQDGVVQTYFRLNTNTGVWSHAIQLNGSIVADYELKAITF